jgi:ketol-acid reductoisomerase
MMADWDADDINLLTWRQQTAETGFERTQVGAQQRVSVRAHPRVRPCVCARVWVRAWRPCPRVQATAAAIPDQEYFDNAVLMVAMVKAGVELAFEEMVRRAPAPVATRDRCVAASL